MYAFPRFESGDVARFTHPDHGMTSDQELCRELLTIGADYVVGQVEVGEWHTNIYLVDFPGRAFNSVMFDKVEVSNGQNV